ncbi:MAG TPA: hypothetical protein VGH57_04635, partial [Amycolatopsis sp.]
MTRPALRLARTTLRRLARLLRVALAAKRRLAGTSLAWTTLTALAGTSLAGSGLTGSSRRNLPTLSGLPRLSTLSRLLRSPTPLPQD